MNRIIDLQNPCGVKVLVMGLGQNGGGVASARYFASRGAEVAVTDLLGEEKLTASLEALQPYRMRTVLGRHDEADVEWADLVVKNPGVLPTSPFLRKAKRVVTDIEVFLSQCSNPIHSVTGSKGKSSTVSALHHILRNVFPGTLLGGNITISPLTFLDSLDGVSPVVLELSSWQLRDLGSPGMLRSRTAALTNLYHDHMNVYASMEEYAADKQRIFQGQDDDAWSLINLDNPWGAYFAQQVRARLGVVSLKGRLPFPGAQAYGFYLEGIGYLEWKGRREKIVPKDRVARGIANDYALLFAGMMATLSGVPSPRVWEESGSFPGIEHRMERCHQAGGVWFINDTAATIPEAAVLSYNSLRGRVHWITGGTDKNLDLSPFEKLPTPPASLVLLDGSATRRLLPVFQSKGWNLLGPFGGMRMALEALRGRLEPGDTVLLSPGAASFELFQNEFDRGRQFKNLAQEIFHG